ncbi:ankyrin repeat and KH domain-containing protein mask-like isoform X3 [Armigeres subalbatus]|uniref:ankyrin repeat and KH domain-containing protein mask-like isoform X3 n=1 Tax=Armigeres subalbatus TaxID=124917 RepID=UPI002ED51F95
MQNAEQSGLKNRDKSSRGSSSSSSVKKSSSLVNQSKSKQALPKQQQPTSSSNGSGSGNSCASVGGSNRSSGNSGGNGVSVGSGTAAPKGKNPKQQQNNSCRVQQPEVEVTTGSANSNNNREVANNAKSAAMSTVAAASASTGSNQNSSSSGTAAATSAGGGGGGAGGRQTNSQHSSPAKSDTETTFSEFQPRVSDSSESDEESVSEVDSFPLDQQSIEIPETECSDSCENDVDMDESDSCDNDADDNDDTEDDDEDDDDIHSTVVTGKLLLENYDDMDHDSGGGGSGGGVGSGASHDKKARLEALLEAADEAAQALTRMRSSEGGGSPRDKKNALRNFSLLSRSLLAACTDNDVNTVRRLLGEGNSLNEATDDGDSLLSLACSAGYYELAQVLLAMSAQVEDRGHKNDLTPLMETASAGHVDIIKLLLKHGADVNAQSSTGSTPLMFACAGGHEEVVRVLLDNGANVEDHNENGHTPLMEAASAGHVGVAKILLERGAGINTHSNEFKESALTLACYKGHLDMVRYLLEAGADQEHKTDEMHTALMEASMDGHVEVARLLLDSGAQVNMPKDSFESPLTLAACGGHVDLAMLLIERGANIEEVNDEGYTPLMEAAREGHEEMVALLLQQGANINAQTEETQETALTLACCGGFVEVADYLIKHGADIELGASTPLMEAAQEGHIDLVRFLLENRADVHAQTQTGDTALTYACENGHTEVADILLYYGAELEHESEGGRTPLMKACRAGHWCIVKFLIEKEADVNRHTTNNDHTPLSLACAGGHQTIVELLLKNHADPFHKLKDNSTMLIEAAKGGHIGVVQLLLDFPHSLISANNAAQQNLLNNGQIQLQAQQQLQQQQQQAVQQQQLIITQSQQQQQLLAAPPGLHEVPESIRVSNKQLFQQHPSKEGLDQQQQLLANNQMLANSNVFLDGNIASTDPSILHQMRMIQMQGFKDGLAQGLSRTPGQQQQQQQQQQTILSQQIPSHLAAAHQQQQHQQIILQGTNNATVVTQQQQTAGVAGVPVGNKQQRSLLRKKQQPTSTATAATVSQPQQPSPFEANLTSSEAQQVRSEPIGEDNGGGGQQQQRASVVMRSDYEAQYQKQMREMYQKSQKANIQFISDANGPPPTLLPSTGTYIDIITPAQGAKTSDSGLVIASSLPTALQQQQLQLTTTIAASAASSSTMVPSGAVTAPAATTMANTASSGSGTLLIGPSEVSQSTAISDRPKVKPVSKKDAKNNRKSAAAAAAAAAANVAAQQQQQAQKSIWPNTANALQQNQMVSIYNNLSVIPTSEVQVLQHSLSNLSLQSPAAPATVGPASGSVAGGVQQQQQQQLTISVSQGSTNSTQQPMMAGNRISLGSTTSASIPLSNNIVPTPSMVITSGTVTSVPANVIQTRNNLIRLDQHALELANSASPFATATSTATSSAASSQSGGTSSGGGSSSSSASGSSSSGSSSSSSSSSGSGSTTTTTSSNNSGGTAASGTGAECGASGSAAGGGASCSDNSSEHENQLNQLALNTLCNQKMLQKIAQRFMVDPKSPPDTPPLSCANPDGPSSPPPSGKGLANNAELDDLSRIFSEVMHDFRSDLLPTPEFVQVHQHVSNIIQHKAGSNQIKISESDSHHQYVEDNDDHLQMFNIDDSENETMSECVGGIYPTLDESLETFNPEDGSVVAADGSRETIYNYEWVECIDEVIHALNGCTDIPVALQEMAANLSCQDIDAYANLIGMNSFCKNRWASNQSQLTPSGTSSPIEDDGSTINLAQATAEQCAFRQGIAVGQAVAGQVMAFDPNQQISLDQLQLLSQLQASNTASGTTALHHAVTAGGAPDAPGTTTADDMQPKFVFNVDADKASQVHLLFQMPAGQQQQQQELSFDPHIYAKGFAAGLQLRREEEAEQAQLQQQAASAAAAAQQQFQTPNLVHPNSVILAQQQQAQSAQQLQQLHAQAQAAHCTQHAQVQVATQTQQPQTGGLLIPRQQSPQTVDSATSTKKKSDKSRKEKNRIAGVRQAPAGQQSVAAGGYQFEASPTPAAIQYPAGVPTNAVQERQIDVDSETDSNHDTALTLACAGGHEELVELLISRGANIEHKDKKGFTPLILAATAGHEKVVETLLRHGAEMEAQSERTKDTPLSLACSGGRYEVVELLLNMNANREHRNVSDYTPLSLAASGGYVNIIKLLLSHGAEINSRTGSKLGISPLMLAAMNGHTAAVKLLLDMGSDINAQIETNRNTALTLACFQGRHEVVSLLLDRKANVEHRAKTGLTPLMEAASGGYIEVGRVLLDKGADVNAAPVPSSRDTALTIAADKGHLKFVELLLSRGAAVEVKNKKGNSPLWLAANGGHQNVVEVLCNAGADIDSQDNRKVSCLMAAFRKGHTKVVKWMVNHVTQFPSDQEMTRYINTISDKELLEKCHDCVKVIRAAKEQQAIKASHNASILLQELELEHTREESRKAAAAKRRERKKRRKAEKREQQRKLVEGDKQPGGNSDNEDDNDDDKDDDDNDSDRDDEELITTMAHQASNRASANSRTQPRQQHHQTPATSTANTANNAAVNSNSNDKEEGDSGIDANSQGSCSSSDVKSSALIEQQKRNNKKRKQQLQQQQQQQQARINIIKQHQQQLHQQQQQQYASNQQNRQSKSPETSNSSSVVQDKNQQIQMEKEKLVSAQQQQQQQLQRRQQMQQQQQMHYENKREKTVEKENVAPKEAVTAKVEPKKDHHHHHPQQQQQQSQSNHSQQQGNRKSIIVFGNRHAVAAEKEEHDTSESTTFYSQLKKAHANSKTTYYHSEDQQNQKSTSPTKQTSSGAQQHQQPGMMLPNSVVSAAKREEGWKEVVRKSSVQQSQSASVMECKKVQVPVHAISRVIGRAGTNINAIRAATGAHIEVEKQGKVQGDRSITIKGSLDATKQAHALIATLIKDPDVDILQMLSKHNTATTTTSKTISSSSASSTSSSSSSVLATVSFPVTASIIPTGSTAPTLSSVVASGGVGPLVSSSGTPKGKNIFATSNQNKPVTASAVLAAATGKSVTGGMPARPPAAKNLFSGNTGNASQMSRIISSNTSAASTLVGLSKDGKRLTSLPPSNASSSKASYTNIMQSLKNTMKNSSGTVAGTGGNTGGTFAKLVADSTLGMNLATSNAMNNQKKLIQAVTPGSLMNLNQAPASSSSCPTSGVSGSSITASAPTTIRPVQIQQSPAKGLPAPFGTSSSIPTSTNNSGSAMTSIASTTSILSSTAAPSSTSQIVVAATPVTAAMPSQQLPAQIQAPTKSTSSFMPPTVAPTSSVSNTIPTTSSNCKIAPVGTGSGRSITPIGQPPARTNITPSPLLQPLVASSSSPSSHLDSVIVPGIRVNATSTSPIGSGLTTVGSSSAAAAASAIAQLQSKINNNLHANAQAHEYSLFNDSYGSSQWGTNTSTGAGPGSNAVGTVHGPHHPQQHHHQHPHGGHHGGGHHHPGSHHGVLGSTGAGAGVLDTAPGGSKTIYGNPHSAGSSFIENEPPLQVDASKAPGYRGTTVSSPVSSKTSSNSVTPPSGSSSVSQQQHHQQQSHLLSGGSSAVGGPPNSNTGSSLQQQQQQMVAAQQQHQQSQPGPFPSPNEQNVIKPPQPQQTPPSGLAVQRPILNTSSQIRPIGPVSSDYGGLVNSRDHPPPLVGSSRPPPSMYDALQQQNQHVLNFAPDPMQSSFQSHMGLGSGAGGLQMSRLNPKASAFSAIPPSHSHQSSAPGSKLSSSNQFGNMFHPNQPSGPIGKYQNLPPNGGGPQLAPYGPGRGNAQSHGQHGPAPGPPGPPGSNRVGSGTSWFSDLAHLQARDNLMNMENGLAMALGGSPTISPNNNQPTTNGGGLVGGPPVGGLPPPPDDGRKMARAIGSERASWKFNYGSSGGIGGMDNDALSAAAAAVVAAGTGHWMVDKNLTAMASTGGGPQQWMGPPPRHFMEDLHLPDHFPMEYHNPLGGTGGGSGPNQPNMNFMQSLQYQFMPGGPNDMGVNDGPLQQPWEHEKHGWPTKWSGH